MGCVTKAFTAICWSAALCLSVRVQSRSFILPLKVFTGTLHTSLRPQLLLLPLDYQLLSSAPATDGRCSLSNLGSNLWFFMLVIRFSIQPGRALRYPDEGTWILTHTHSREPFQKHLFIKKKYNTLTENSSLNKTLK